MTQTTKTVFEKYEIRKTKKQKSAFIDYVKSIAAENGYQSTVEKGTLGARNIVVGSPEKAKVIYTAHYDTCPVLPFPNFITPKNFLIYLLYQIAIMLLVFIPAILLSALFEWIAPSLPIDPGDVSFWSLMIYEAVLIGFIILLLAGPANKHTANDNTSGVTTLLNLMIAMPEELRENAAFVFFDLEESGLIGSSSFANKHKQTMKNKPLINFDCVSDGEHILFVVRKKADIYVPMLKKAFSENENVKVEIVTKGVFYPSDQANFAGGIGVAALKKSKRLGILYMDRIHTGRDTVYREENIAFLTQGTIKFTELLSNS
ncbi:MAG: M28 family peptidase [Clostridia bacterium]|nr:M28 family peptidase [Clostridia bacterium]